MLASQKSRGYGQLPPDGAMMKKEAKNMAFSETVKDQAFARAGGRCECHHNTMTWMLRIMAEDARKPSHNMGVSGKHTIK